jgi:membrane protease YdiL (CAAX protease family)
MSAWIKKNSVLSYYVLTILWSYGWWAWLYMIAPAGIGNGELPPIAFLFITMGGFGPFIASLVISRIADGPGAIGKLFARLLKVRANPIWFLIAFVLIPLNTWGSAALLPVFGIDPGPMDFLPKIIPGVCIGLMAGFMEELGWRGFLQPRLQKRFSALASALIIGLIWGVWHGLPDFWGAGSQMGELVIPYYLLVGPGILTLYSIFQAWIANNTKGSLFFAVFFHASISSSAFIFSPSVQMHEVTLYHAVISVVINAIEVLVIILFFGPKLLSRKPENSLKENI